MLSNGLSSHSEPGALLYYFVKMIDGRPHDPLKDTRISVPSDTTVKIIYNVAKWYLTLEKVHFDTVGSLHFDPVDNNKFIIGPVVEFDPQTGEPPFYKGPYKDAADHYADYFDTAMKQIVAGTRSWPQFDLDHYLISLEARSLVVACEELRVGPWYMKHADDRGDHFLVREDGSVAGVLDWDWQVLLSIFRGEEYAYSQVLYVLQGRCLRPAPWLHGWSFLARFKLYSSVRSRTHGRVCSARQAGSRQSHLR